MITRRSIFSTLALVGASLAGGGLAVQPALAGRAQPHSHRHKLNHRRARQRRR